MEYCTLQVRLDNLRFFDPSQSPAVRDNPLDAAQALTAAKSEELAAEANESHKLLLEDAENGLLDHSPPEAPPPLEYFGALPSKQKMSVSWMSAEPSDPILGRIRALDEYLSSDNAHDLLVPLCNAEAAAVKRASDAAAVKAAAKAKVAKASNARGRKPKVSFKTLPTSAPLAVPLNAPVLTADRRQFESGLKAFSALVSVIEDEDDRASGELYLKSLEKVNINEFIFSGCFVTHTDTLICPGPCSWYSLVEIRSGSTVHCLSFSQFWCRKAGCCDQAYERVCLLSRDC